MHDRLDGARVLLPGVRLSELERLGGSERSIVHRVRARWPDQPETTLIVKQFVMAGEGWARECSALAIAGDDAPTARVVAEDGAPPIVVMADLGTGATVADALLGSDPAAAAYAVTLWAESIASLHRATLGSRERFRAELHERAGDLPVADATMSTSADDAVRLLEHWCGQLGVPVPSGSLSELRELPRRLGSDGPAALTPADACPDNNVLVVDRLMLVDFEGAQWRHIAWDVAYLSVPWPSCWCSWRMPSEVSERAFEHYRAAMQDVLPYVRTPEFRRDVVAAAVGWEVMSTAWFLPAAIADDPPRGDPNRPTPTRRAMILHRLDGARRCDDLAALAELARRLRAALVARWGEVPLAYAPAFEAPS